MKSFTDTLKYGLCCFGIHKWLYSNKDILEINKGQVNLLTNYRVRNCKWCTKKQLRTKLPMVDGVDTDNSWINY